jgi:Response regulator containing a CheY-like receiver domain and an HTH DNA-binding domain
MLMPIRIALAEDNELFRRGMVVVLQRIRDFELKIVAVNGKDLLQELPSEPVDVVLLDIMMPEMDGIEAASIISKEYPEVKMLAITMFDQEVYLQKMLEAGVSGYVIKDINSEQLEKAIRAVYEGKCYYSEELLHLFGKMMKQNMSKEKSNKLSKREEEVVNLIAKGYSSEKIGEVLNISVKTVSNHRNNIYSKLGVQNTAELISYAYKNRILTLE